MLAAPSARRLALVRLAQCQFIALNVAHQAATAYWAVTAVRRTSVDTACLQKPKTRLARMLAAPRARRLGLVRLAQCQFIALNVAHQAATAYWAVTAVCRTSVDTTCLQKPETRLARMLVDARAERLGVVRLAPRQHTALNVAHQAATAYCAVTAVRRTSVDTTCIQKPETRLACMLADARAGRLGVVRLAPCRHTALNVAHQAATAYWAVTAVRRTSVDTTCLQNPKTRLARMLADARAGRLNVVRLAPCRHVARNMAHKAATAYWAVTAVRRTFVDTTCLQKP